MLLNEPPYLNARGRALWDKLTAGNPDPVQEVLILQACRLVDTLDRLDGAKRSKKVWFALAEEAEGSFGGSGTEVKIIVDNLLAEYRQQAVALAAILAKITVEIPKAPRNNRSQARQAAMRERYEQAGLGEAPDIQ